MIMGPMCCNVMLVKNCSIQNQMLFHLTVFPLKTNALGEMSCTFMLCFKSYIYPVSDLGKPSKEQLSLQLELQRLQSARRLDAEEFDNQKQVLQAQLQSEVSYITAPCCGKQFFFTLKNLCSQYALKSLVIKKHTCRSLLCPFFSADGAMCPVQSSADRV